MAHVRLKFADVRRAQGSSIAEEAIARIADLYAVEKMIRGVPPEARPQARRERAAPVLNALEAWLAEQLPALSGTAPLAGSIRYALNRLPWLRPYLTDGSIEIDNNAAERAMRGCALGRKNSHDRRQGYARTSSLAQSGTGTFESSPMGWCRALRSQRRLLKLSFGDLARAAP